jgi:hypothetical protein
MNAQKLFHSIFSLALVIILFSSPTQPVQADSLNPLIETPEFQALYEKALAEGTVRIIVGLNIGREFVPVGYLRAKQAEDQRLAIQTVSSSLVKAMEGRQIVVDSTYQYIPYIALRVSAPALEYLAMLSTVSSLHENMLSKPTLESSTLIIGAPTVWEADYTGSGWAVAVLDTGSQWDHPFLAGRVVSEACYSYDNGDTERTLCPDGTQAQTTGHAADPTTAMCWNGGINICDHGTHVAGIATGNGASGSVAPFNGVAPGANIIAIQVFTRFNDDADCGTGYAPCVMSYTDDQLAGLDRVFALSQPPFNMNIASVNMSLGGGWYRSNCDKDKNAKVYLTPINNLASVGIATVIASGNDGYTNAVGAPACISTAVTVGATTDFDVVASFSNSDDQVDLLAPGVNIDSSVPVSTYANFNGTSMATPHVAGAWAVMKSIDPSVSVDQILSRLQSTGVSVTDSRNGITRSRIQLDAAARVSLPTLTWTGNTSTAWDNTGNWSIAVLPTSLNSVTIPSSPSGGRFPTLSTIGNVYDLNISAGAQMFMPNGILNVYNNFTVISGGFFNATGGTLVFQGTDDQTITMPDDANNQLYHVEIGDGTTKQELILDSNLDVNGNLTIQGGNNLQPGAYTLSVAGNWVDAEGGFLPNTSTIIFDGTSAQSAQITASQLLLVHEDFSAYDDLAYSWFSYDGPTGWVVENTSGDDYPWFFTGWARLPNTILNGHIRHYTTVANATTWVFTPAMNLFSGFSYQLQFKNGVYSNSRSLRVALGSAQNSASMTTVLQDYTVTNTSWQNRSINFTVPSDGVYYLGFRSMNGSNTGDGQGLDDIFVSVTPKLLFHNLTIDTTNSNFTLGDDALVQNDLVVNDGGQLDLSTYNLAVNGTLTNNSTIQQTKDLSPGTTTQFIQVTNAAGDTTKYQGVWITPPETASVSSTTVEIRGNQSECQENSTTIDRCFDITPSVVLSTATIRFWYLNSEAGTQDVESMKAYHWDGYGWNPLQLAATPPGTSGDYEWVEAVNVDTYSPFGLADKNPYLPTGVPLSGFSALPDKAMILVTWQTSFELDTIGFNLYRATSIDGETNLLTYIPSQGFGASGLPTDYQYIDDDLQPGLEYYYWLEMLSTDNETMIGPVTATAPFGTYLPLIR